MQFGDTLIISNPRGHNRIYEILYNYDNIGKTNCQNSEDQIKVNAEDGYENSKRN